jgi:hypothetical protein
MMSSLQGAGQGVTKERIRLQGYVRCLSRNTLVIQDPILPGELLFFSHAIFNQRNWILSHHEATLYSIFVSRLSDKHSASD